MRAGGGGGWGAVGIDGAGGAVVDGPWRRGDGLGSDDGLRTVDHEAVGRVAVRGCRFDFWGISGTSTAREGARDGGCRVSMPREGDTMEGANVAR